MVKLGSNMVKFQAHMVKIKKVLLRAAAFRGVARNFFLTITLLFIKQEIRIPVFSSPGRHVCWPNAVYPSLAAIHTSARLSCPGTSKHSTPPVLQPTVVFWREHTA